MIIKKPVFAWQLSLKIFTNLIQYQAYKILLVHTTVKVQMCIRYPYKTIILLWKNHQQLLSKNKQTSSLLRFHVLFSKCVCFYMLLSTWDLSISSCTAEDKELINASRSPNEVCILTISLLSWDNFRACWVQIHMQLTPVRTNTLHVPLSTPFVISTPHWQLQSLLLFLIEICIQR